MSITLFNISLDALLKKCNLKVIIINRAIQLVVYNDELEVIARIKKGLEKATLLIRQKAEKRKVCT